MLLQTNIRPFSASDKTGNIVAVAIGVSLGNGEAVEVAVVVGLGRNVSETGTSVGEFLIIGVGVATAWQPAISPARIAIVTDFCALILKVSFLPGNASERSTPTSVHYHSIRHSFSRLAGLYEDEVLRTQRGGHAPCTAALRFQAGEFQEVNLRSLRYAVTMQCAMAQASGNAAGWATLIAHQCAHTS